MRVKRTRSSMITIADDDRRFIPAGMTGTIVEIADDGRLSIVWDHAFARFPVSEPDGDGCMGIEKCEEQDVPIHAIEWTKV